MKLYKNKTMEKLNNLLKTEQDNIKVEQSKLKQLQNEMADPKSLNIVANNINNSENEIHVLKLIKEQVTENKINVSIAIKNIQDNIKDIKEESYYDKDFETLKQVTKHEQILDKQAKNFNKQDSTDIVQEDFSPFDDLD